MFSNIFNMPPVHLSSLEHCEHCLANIERVPPVVVFHLFFQIEEEEETHLWDGLHYRNRSTSKILLMLFIEFLPVCNFSSHWAPTYTQPEEHMTAKSFYFFSSFVTLVAFRFLIRKVSSCLGEGVKCYFSLPPHPLPKEYLLKNKFWFSLRTLPPKMFSRND